MVVFDVLVTHVILMYFIVVGLLAVVFWYFGFSADKFYLTVTYLTYCFVIFVVILFLVQ